MAGTTTRKQRGRKLLIASVGVAAVSYVACNGTYTTGNLVPPPQEDAATDAASDADSAPEDSGNYMDVVANLIAPPIDASADGADK